jgi:hypothetical protein
VNPLGFDSPNDKLKREKARSPLKLLKKRRKEASAGKEDIRAAQAPGRKYGQGALKRSAADEYQSPQGAVLAHVGDKGAGKKARGSAEGEGGSSQEAGSGPARDANQGESYGGL